MSDREGVVPDNAKDSADDLDNINQEHVDHSQSAPEDDDEAAVPGPTVGDAFRGGS